MGRLVRDPELKETGNGKSYVRFTLAIDYAKDKDGNKLTNFVPCMAWDKRAEVIQKYFLKGQRMLVTNAMLMVRSYVDDEGNNRSYTYVNVSDFEFVETKPKTDEPATTKPKNDEESWFASMGDIMVDF